MKVILSRKGFDSAAGGIPSPILPDGTLLSMPIPADNANTYDELFVGEKSYMQILKELKPSFQKSNCHLDPDIRKDCCVRADNWVAAFGQAGAALTHLENQGVGEGDLFLYFGWFRKTEYTPDGKLQFVKGAPDVHVIFGYLQIGKILKGADQMESVLWHPHVGYRDSLNAILVASDRVLDLDKPGYGVFSYDERLVLTKPGEQRSRWLLPQCLQGKNLSYHSAKNIRDGYFQSAMRGQEFVIEADDDILDWVKSLMIE